MTPAHVCGICFEECTKAVHGDGCLHPFCLSCLQDWTRTNRTTLGTTHATCPVCRKKYYDLVTMKGVTVDRNLDVQFFPLHFLPHTSAAIVLQVHNSWKPHYPTIAYVLQNYAIGQAKKWLGDLFFLYNEAATAAAVNE